MANRHTSFWLALLVVAPRPYQQDMSSCKEDSSVRYLLLEVPADAVRLASVSQKTPVSGGDRRQFVAFWA